jgi:hypothetical protein
VGVEVEPERHFSAGADSLLESDVSAFAEPLSVDVLLVSVDALDAVSEDVLPLGLDESESLGVDVEEGSDDAATDDGGLVRPLMINPAPVPMSRSSFNLAQLGHFRFTEADMVCTSSNVCSHALHR